MNVLFLAHSLPITKRKRNTHVLRSIDQNTVLLLLLLPNGGDHRGFSATRERERDGTKEYMCAAQSVERTKKEDTHEFRV